MIARFQIDDVKHITPSSVFVQATESLLIKVSMSADIDLTECPIFQRGKITSPD